MTDPDGVGGLSEHIRENLAEMFIEVPEPIAYVFIGMVGLGMPIGLGLVGYALREFRRRRVIRRRAFQEFAGGVLLVGIGLMMALMAGFIFLIAVEEKFGFTV